VWAGRRATRRPRGGPSSPAGGQRLDLQLRLIGWPKRPARELCRWKAEGRAPGEPAGPRLKVNYEPEAQNWRAINQSFPFNSDAPLACFLLFLWPTKLVLAAEWAPHSARSPVGPFPLRPPVSACTQLSLLWATLCGPPHTLCRGKAARCGAKNNTSSAAASTCLLAARERRQGGRQ